MTIIEIIRTTPLADRDFSSGVSAVLTPSGENLCWQVGRLDDSEDYLTRDTHADKYWSNL